MTAVLRPMVELVGVSREFPGGVHALRDVSLTIARGELVAIRGASGSGKSTLLNVMGTLDTPTSGSVVIDGQATAGLSDNQLSALRARSLGFVFQQCHLSSGTTALENVMTSLLYSRVPRRKRRVIAAAALDRVGLSHRMLHRSHELSGGERQRVAIARAAVHEPALLLADEPTGALDTENGLAVLDLLFALHRSGTTIVVITHDRDIAARLPRRVGVRDGLVVDEPVGDRPENPARTTPEERT